MSYQKFKRKTLEELSTYKEQVLEIQEKGTFRPKTGDSYNERQ